MSSPGTTGSVGCVDHLVMACADLDSGIRELENLTGVTASGGGRHPAWGSHNALIGLGPRTYLEVIAPDPGSTVPADRRPEVFTSPGPGLLNGWVAVCEDIPGARARARQFGMELGGPIDGRRERADGTVLEWVLTDPSVRHLDGLVPILIDWGDSPHPASSAPSGCSLLALELRHPDPGPLVEVLAAIGLSVTVVKAPVPGLRAILDTPRGVVELG